MAADAVKKKMINEGGEENSNRCNAGDENDQKQHSEMKSSWKKPVLDDKGIEAPASVMGAKSWPPLAEARPKNYSADDSSAPAKPKSTEDGTGSVSASSKPVVVAATPPPRTQNKGPNGPHKSHGHGSNNVSHKQPILHHHKAGSRRSHPPNGVQPPPPPIPAHYRPPPMAPVFHTVPGPHLKVNLHEIVNKFQRNQIEERERFKGERDNLNR